ncbi:hypothetical protein BN1708_007952, partial [Verticillium longisporum]
KGVFAKAENLCVSLMRPGQTPEERRREFIESFFWCFTGGAKTDFTKEDLADLHDKIMAGHVPEEDRKFWNKYSLKLVRFLADARLFVTRGAVIGYAERLRPDTVTAEEKARGNQIAIHFLATCRAMHTEGTRILWGHNSFTFTSPEALRHFAELDLNHRKGIKGVTFRIIAQFYDDKKRRHRLHHTYHQSLRKDHQLPVNMRVNEQTYARGGFRCYSWSQIVDFLAALRPPFDPKHDRKQIRPRLLPALESLHIDLVNFTADKLPTFGNDMHNMASHELGCSLNELYVTGLPIDDPGVKASAELTGLLRDEGLYMTGVPAYVQTKRGVLPLSGHPICARVIRAYKSLRVGSLGASTVPIDDELSDSEDTDFDALDGSGLDAHHSHIPTMPAAPAQEGHPTSHREDKVIWKRVPISRNSGERRWVEFCRSSGYPIEPPADKNGNDDDEEDEDSISICPCCGEPHPGTFLDQLLDEAD